MLPSGWISKNALLKLRGTSFRGCSMGISLIDSTCSLMNRLSFACLRLSTLQCPSQLCAQTLAVPLGGARVSGRICW